ncbi:hypothetical protein C8R45DRAFT_498887 [Mycena sanguinolenta]|nr:hypothetical protein C8R45DRAFT_498887 [Mycena sanguinolenta]
MKSPRRWFSERAKLAMGKRAELAMGEEESVRVVGRSGQVLVYSPLLYDSSREDLVFLVPDWHRYAEIGHRYEETGTNVDLVPCACGRDRRLLRFLPSPSQRPLYARLDSTRDARSQRHAVVAARLAEPSFIPYRSRRDSAVDSRCVTASGCSRVHWVRRVPQGPSSGVCAWSIARRPPIPPPSPSPSPSARARPPSQCGSGPRADDTCSAVGARKVEEMEVEETKQKSLLIPFRFQGSTIPHGIPGQGVERRRGRAQMSSATTCL